MQVTDTTAGPWGPAQMPREQPKKATSWVMPPLDDDDNPEDDDHVFSSTTNQPPHQLGQPDGLGEDPMVLAAM